MSKKKYVLGIDFGTESGRAVLVQVKDGKEIGSEVYKYSNGVIDEKLPGTSVRLGHEWALQDPEDYVRTLEKTVKPLIRRSKVKPDDVIGIGIDFTACTMLPTDAAGRPLCNFPQFRKNPHAWVKLWKHHAAQPEADKLNAIARERGESFLERYGGKISSEWFFPKAWQILDEAPEVYAAGRLIEAADWIVWRMTGVETRNSCTAGYKAIWEKATGFPSKEFFKALDPRLENIVDEKMSTNISPLGAKAGGLTPEMAELMGLKPGTAVAVANVDAHVAVPATTVTGVGKMVMIMGTSICHMVCGTEKKIVPGMCGVVEDGILPGLFGFEAGQSCVGDHFAWFTRTCVPKSYEAEAKKRGISVHELLEKKASKQAPGEHGLIALDWWNGNRSVLVDADLSGMLLGATLQTKPEDIYRALIEATAFGTKKIIDTFTACGVAVDEIYCCGGLPERNKMLMQIYSDVTGRPMKISASAQTPALGSAMHGAVAAGSAAGGYDTIQQAAARMARVRRETYKPKPENNEVYQRLFAEYDSLHDYFGRGANGVMKRLKRLKAEQAGRRRR